MILKINKKIFLLLCNYFISSVLLKIYYYKYKNDIILVYGIIEIINFLNVLIIFSNNIFNKYLLNKKMIYYKFPYKIKKIDIIITLFIYILFLVIFLYILRNNFVSIFKKINNNSNNTIIIIISFLLLKKYIITNYIINKYLFNFEIKISDFNNIEENIKLSNKNELIINTDEVKKKQKFIFKDIFFTLLNKYFSIFYIITGIIFLFNQYYNINLEIYYNIFVSILFIYYTKNIIKIFIKKINIKNDDDESIKELNNAISKLKNDNKYSNIFIKETFNYSFNKYIFVISLIIKEELLSDINIIVKNNREYFLKLKQNSLFIKDFYIEYGSFIIN